jgi:archaellum biogenesis ATPase FlaH|tara:strand:+ start:229 stop:1314 length:1086 start_codon:yes stop_codon:yes gene_type:complete
MRTKTDFYTDIIDNAILIHQGVDIPPPPVFYDWTHFINDTTPEPPHIIGKGILPQKSLAILAGEPKVGKSHMAVSLAYHIATGQSWFQFPVSHPHKVLIVQAENSYFNQRNRIQLINRITQPPYNMPKLAEKQLLVSDPIHNLNVNENEGYALLNTLLVQHTPQVLIIDPLVNFHTAEENSNSEMAQVMDKLHNIKDDYNISIILIHHIRKPSNTQDSTGTSIRGASSIRGSYDTGISLTKQYNAQSNQDYHQLEFELRNGPTPDPLTLELDPTCLTFQKIEISQTCKDFILESLNYVKENGILQKQLVQEGMEENYTKNMIIRTITGLKNQNIITESKEKRNKTLWMAEFTNQSFLDEKI